MILLSCQQLLSKLIVSVYFICLLACLLLLYNYILFENVQKVLAKEKRHEHQKVGACLLEHVREQRGRNRGRYHGHAGCTLGKGANCSRAETDHLGRQKRWLKRPSRCSPQWKCHRTRLAV